MQSGGSEIEALHEAYRQIHVVDDSDDYNHQYSSVEEGRFHRPVSPSSPALQPASTTESGETLHLWRVVMITINWCKWRNNSCIITTYSSEDEPILPSDVTSQWSSFFNRLVRKCCYIKISSGLLKTFVTTHD